MAPCLIVHDLSPANPPFLLNDHSRSFLEALGCPLGLFWARDPPYWLLQASKYLGKFHLQFGAQWERKTQESAPINFLKKRKNFAEVFQGSPGWRNFGGILVGNFCCKEEKKQGKKRFTRALKVYLKLN